MAKKKTVKAEEIHSKKFYLIKDYYDRGLWNVSRVRAVVAHGWITPEEFKEITGQDYTEE